MLRQPCTPWPYMALALVLGLFAFFTSPTNLAGAFERGSGRIVTDDGAITLELEFAITPAQRQQGLMFRQELGAMSGMLFDYGEERHVSMWMHNTPLTLDMLFIDAGGVIRRIAAYTEPFSRETISSNRPVRYVLEVNGGFARSHGVKPGDTFEVLEGPQAVR